MLADEPTGNLDSKSTDAVMNLISDLHREGTTIVVITHDAIAAALRDSWPSTTERSLLTQRVTVVKREASGDRHESLHPSPVGSGPPTSSGSVRLDLVLAKHVLRSARSAYR